MTILTLDTSGPVCSVAILKDGSLRYEARAVNQLTHSRNLMPMLDEAFSRSGVTKAEITHIAAVVGPGSFTGVRIAVAAAQGLARGLSIPCLAVNALEAMANAVPLKDTLVCPLRDARAGQVYAALFRGGARAMEDSALKLDELLGQLAERKEPVFFLGDGAAVYHERIVSVLGEQAIIAPPHLLQSGAAAAAALASRKTDEGLEPGELMPLYLRAPQAERLRAEKHG